MVFVVFNSPPPHPPSSGLHLSSLRRYTLAGAYALSRRTQMRAPIVFAYFKLFRGRDAKWSVASAQWSDPPRLSTPLLFFFSHSFLSYLSSLSRSRKYADAHGATHRVIDTTNGAHRVAPRSYRAGIRSLAHARAHFERKSILARLRNGRLLKSH